MEPIIKTDWTEFKNICIARKQLNLQSDDLGPVVRVIGPDSNQINIVINLRKLNDDGTDNPDYLDYVANVAPICNFPVGTRQHPFAISDYEFMPTMVQGVCPAGGSHKISLSINEKCNLNGGKLITDGNAVFGDWVECAVEDLYGLIPTDYRDANWPVLKKWIPKWGVDWKACSETIETVYAGTPFPNFHVTFTYHSVGPNPVGFAVNFLLHRPI